MQENASDVVIIGGGIIGSACAYYLAAEGFSVTVLEAARAANGTTSHGEGNILVSDKGPGDELALALDSTERWPALVAAARDELGPNFPSAEYDPKGGVVVATTEPGLVALDAFSAGQRTVGVRAEKLDIPAALEYEPALNPEVAGAYWYPQDAQVQPVGAAQMFLALAKRRGARIVEGVRVTGGLVHGGRLTGVRTDRGDYAAGSVVNAAGPASGIVGELLGGPIPIEPRRGCVLVASRSSTRIRHKVYNADYVGAVGASEAELIASAVIESTEGGTVLIGSSRERVGFDDRISPRVYRKLAENALALFPALGDANVIRSYFGFRPYCVDHLPIIGEDHRLPGLFHATGHEGAGIGLAPATGALLADIMTGRTVDEPQSDESPVWTREDLRATGPRDSRVNRAFTSADDAATHYTDIVETALAAANAPRVRAAAFRTDRPSLQASHGEGAA